MTDEEIEKYIEIKCGNNKSPNITLGVSFNKNCPRQIKLLKKALKYSDSFSGLVKEMLIGLPVDMSEKIQKIQTEVRNSFIKEGIDESDEI